MNEKLKRSRADIGDNYSQLQKTQKKIDKMLTPYERRKRREQDSEVNSKYMLED